jgi:hypothetical protein
MPIDYSVLRFSKGTPRAVEKDERTAKRESADERENDKVKARSGGQCEVFSPNRCQRRASQVHHMLGGNGVRARGKSLLADHKQHVCAKCHPLITSKRLVRIGAEVPLWTDTYKRIRSSRGKA